jgi:GAF domain-containing protein
MSPVQAIDGLQERALDAVVNGLRLMFDIGRCTLRRERSGETFPVVHESLAPGVGSLIGDATVDLRGQPVVRVLTETGSQVVQDDCRTAYADKSFQRMLDLYGGLGAQIVTPVLIDGDLRAIVSLHHLDGPRSWTQGEIALARDAAGLVGRILDSRS